MGAHIKTEALKRKKRGTSITFCSTSKESDIIFYLKPISILVQLLDYLLCAAVILVFTKLEMFLQNGLDSAGWIDLVQEESLKTFQFCVRLGVVEGNDGDAIRQLEVVGVRSIVDQN